MSGKDKDGRHLVLLYMESDLDKPEGVKAVYQGEFREHLVKVGYWQLSLLVIPLWFRYEQEAREYVDSVESTALRPYCIVQERHYAKGSSLIASAKRIGYLENDIYPAPTRGLTPERQGEPPVEVWTMYFTDWELADQYVNAVNDDARSAAAMGSGGDK